MQCPLCSAPIAAPPLDDLILKLIDGHGLSEEAEGFLRLLWQGEIVQTSALLASLYADAPDDEPSIARLYREGRDALSELQTALAAEGSGITIREVGWRQGWRLDFSAAVAA